MTDRGDNMAGTKKKGSKAVVRKKVITKNKIESKEWVTVDELRSFAKSNPQRKV